MFVHLIISACKIIMKPRIKVFSNKCSIKKTCSTVYEMMPLDISPFGLSTVLY